MQVLDAALRDYPLRAKEGKRNLGLNPHVLFYLPNYLLPPHIPIYQQPNLVLATLLLLAILPHHDGVENCASLVELGQVAK